MNMLGKALIEKLDYLGLNLLDIQSALNNQLTLLEIHQTLEELRKESQLRPSNDFGKCGIDPEANPCGDADEY